MSGQQRQLVLSFLAEPSDVNFGGKVHGGQVMRWIDQAGYAAAVGWSGHYSVTVAVGGIRFVAPIRIGDLVSVEATLILTGTTSMHFAVDVRARDPRADAGSERLVIDPGQLIEAMLRHFQKYISDLMNPAEAKLRAKFIRKFDHDILPQIK